MDVVKLIFAKVLQSPDFFLENDSLACKFVENRNHENITC